MYQDMDNDLISIEELCQRLMIRKNMAYHLLNANEIVAFPYRTFMEDTCKVCE